MEIITPFFFLPRWLSCTINDDVVVMPSFPFPFFHANCLFICRVFVLVYVHIFLEVVPVFVRSVFA